MDMFPVAIKFTRGHEGGTNYHVHDRGRLTKFGISQKQYPYLDIENLTWEQAKDIYYNNYWKTCRCDELPGPVAVVMFDTAVNCGVHSASVWLQKVIGAKPDGIIGPETMDKLESGFDPYDVSGKIVGLRMKRYVKLINRKPNQRAFVVGWMNRAAELLAYI